ncbi:hotdog fold domain-containing protein [Clostridium septicum]|uniref:Acyl-CoA hydrolase n=1 Tax=Clostridium septicum TaxID=1504 RepID=A0A9N7JMT1_CLOSE|nr:hotdog fold domain-containing protein [Clostridium septicum]AYE35594.1 acyl-CoA hydrolase [Clostridium septicum]QAS60980.1 acyl-CoA hydrolase [Clostridium septicum]UEC19742.1 acyl-CoA hydrolase [Clostridium septicum]USS02198.1 hotdog fold thioesterase [Clostridium septicum]WLF70777.1 hotdog fold domain-containing protein [Clostridium septicum]
MSFVKLEKNYETKIRYRMSSRDVYYGGGIVNGARSITLLGDVAEKLMCKIYGNFGRCIELENVRLHAPVFAGDYIEFIGRVVEIDEKIAKIECRSYKIAAIPEKPKFKSSIEIYEEPTLSSSFVGYFESR